MKSKTEIKKRKRRKTNSELVETINLANKNEGWRNVASKISMSRRQESSMNLFEIDKISKEGDTVVICGKVLGLGSLSKKIRICALQFSESARAKVKSSKGEIVMLSEEIKKNPKAHGVKIL